MKRQELCAALDKIRPSEELICSTINKMNEQRLGIRQKRSMSTPMFASRLATAVCALLVVIGISVYAPSLSGVDSSDTSDAMRHASTDAGENEGISSASYDMETSEMLASIAKLEHNEWVVLEASVDMCMITSVGEDGSLYNCVLQLGVLRVADSDLSPDIEIPQAEASINASIRIYDEDTANKLFALSDENISFLLTASEGKWTVEDFIIHK